MTRFPARQPAPDASTATDICLTISGLSVMRGQRLVINKLDYHQPAGTLCLLTGANGAGKSTLLRTIAGRLPAESGDIFCPMPAVYVGHADGLAGALTGRQNLQSWAGINDQFASPDKLDAALAGFDADSFADLPVQLLSRGQRRRLALARLLLAPPKSLWLLDEPNTGLDTDGKGRLETSIAAHLASGGSVIAATHVALQVTVNPLNLQLGPH
jgi:heme exporter protein A